MAFKYKTHYSFQQSTKHYQVMYYTNGFKTDHSFVWLKIEASTISKRPGYFKINNSILIEENYQFKINETISNTVKYNPNALWEVIKGSIRKETIKYSSHKIRENKKRKIKNPKWDFETFYKIN